MEVNNLTELFNEFKKYRETKKNVANKENFYDFVSTAVSFKNEENPQLGTMSTDLIDSISVVLKDYHEEWLSFGRLDFGLRSHVWGEIEYNMEKVLKDIWETGEIKDTYGLDLNWPKTSEKNSTNNTELANNSGVEKPNKIQETKPIPSANISQPSFWEKNKGLIFGFGLGFLFFLIISFILWKRRKKQ